MSVGKITKIEQTAGTTTFAGSINDLESSDTYEFKGQTGLDKVSQGDIVSFELNGGAAEKLVPLLQIKTKGLGKSESATRRAVNLSILLCALDGNNDIDIMIKKF